MTRRYIAEAGWIRFEDWGAPHPDWSGLAESMHTARYDLARLTQQDAYRILAAAEAYCHFAGHPASDTSIAKQLKELRKAVREVAP